MRSQVLTAAAGAALLTLANAFDVVETDAAITISNAGETVLVYHKAEVAPPPGADPIFHRSGFIHPLCAPSGQPVTGIHPDDHLHHLGLWGAWVNSAHGKRKPDFWNLKTASGRVRYAKTLSLAPAAGACGFQVAQEHVSLDAGRDPVVVLEEVLTVIAREGDGGAYVIDYNSSQTNITDTALKLPAYRYGGPIAYRGPSHWDKTNSIVLTSEGKTRENGHTTRGRWCAFSGPVEGGHATVAILCHPKNHDAPQRMRIWPPDSHNGAVFFNYVPIQETAWQISPGELSTMRYQLIVSDGKLDKAKTDAAWARFAKE